MTWLGTTFSHEPFAFLKSHGQVICDPSKEAVSFLFLQKVQITDPLKVSIREKADTGVDFV